MLLHHASVLLLLLQVTFGFPRDKTTETPDIPPMANPKLRRPTHISEFTDPDTGLNPFLDLEEGLASLGRNVMEDERRDDQPYMDLDIVEGDAPDRRWNFEEPKEQLGRMPGRRQPELDYKDESDFQAVTIPRILPSPLTTVELFVSKGTEKANEDSVDADQDIQFEVEKEEKASLSVAQSTVIYATVAISVVTVIILVGACWWRRKLTSSRTSTTIESDEVKS